MSPPHLRCVCHPQHHIVGICAFCLQERLVALAQYSSLDMEDDEQSYHLPHHHRHQDSADDGDIDDDCRRPPFHSHQSSISANPNSDVAGSRVELQSSGYGISAAAAGATLSHQLECDASNHRLQTLNARDRASAYATTNAGVGYTESTKKKQRNLASQTSTSSRPSNASEHDTKSLRQSILGNAAGYAYGGNDMLNSQNTVLHRKSKSKASWFSKPKSKPMHHSPISPLLHLQSSGCEVNPPPKSPLHHILAATTAGRRSVACELLNYNGGCGETYHCHHQNDGDVPPVLGFSRLDGVAEISLGDGAAKLDKENSQSHSSWISSLFHRKKGSKSKANGGACFHGKNPNTQGCRTAEDEYTMEAGRLSWDGGKPNLKQVLMKEMQEDELRMNRLQQQGMDMGKEVQYSSDMAGMKVMAYKKDATLLQKCKSVTTGRRSIALEVPCKDGHCHSHNHVKHGAAAVHVLPSPMSIYTHDPQHCAGLGDHHLGNLDDTCCAVYAPDERQFPRSRSWGRVLSRSPLWGSKYNAIATDNTSTAAAGHLLQAPHFNRKSGCATTLPSQSPLQSCHHRHLQAQQCLKNSNAS